MTSSIHSRGEGGVAKGLGIEWGWGLKSGAQTPKPKIVVSNFSIIPI